MKPEKARLVLAGLKEAGVNFAAGVPDAQFIQVYRMVAADPDIRYVGKPKPRVWRWEPGLAE